MSKVQDWMLPEGMHDVARQRIIRDYGRERRKGGRVLTPASWAVPTGARELQAELAKAFRSC